MPMRQRLRPDWDVINFNFEIEPKSDNWADVVFPTAGKMQDLYNRMCEAYQEWKPKYDALEKRSPERSQSIKEFELAVRRIAQKTDLLSNYYYETMDNFMSAVKMALKGKTKKVKNKKGDYVYVPVQPQRKFGLKKVRLPSKFTNGGEPIEYLTKKGSHKKKVFWTKHDFEATALRYADKTLHTGTFRVQNDLLEYRVIQHRQFPEEAIIKRIALCGELIRPFGWKWKIVLTLEVPPPVAPRFDNGRVASIDFGWRVRKGGYRVAAVLDHSNDQFTELVLPEHAETAKTRRAKYKMPTSFQDLEDLQTEQSKLTEILRGKVKDIIERSETDDFEWLKRKKAMRLLGSKKLSFLRKDLTEKENTAGLEDFESEILAHLNDWSEKFYSFWRRITALRKRLEGQRNHLYQEYAAWLAAHYDALIWIGDLDLKRIAELSPKSDQYAIRFAGRNRHFVSISTFRRYIKNAFHKQGKKIYEAEAENTTKLDSKTGKPLKITNNLLVETSQGLEDVDKNACRNLFNQFESELVVVRNPEKLEPPEKLKKFIRELK